MLRIALGGEEHAVGLLPSHLARREVQDRDDLFADELLRLGIEGLHAGQDLPRRAAAVVQEELEQLVGIGDLLAGEDLAGSLDAA